MRGDRVMPGARPGLICSGDIARGMFSAAIDSVGARCGVKIGRQFGRGTGPVNRSDSWPRTSVRTKSSQLR